MEDGRALRLHAALLDGVDAVGAPAVLPGAGLVGAVALEAPAVGPVALGTIGLCSIGPNAIGGATVRLEPAPGAAGLAAPSAHPSAAHRIHAICL